MNYEIEYITNTGKVRTHNEDSLLIGDNIISNYSSNEITLKEINTHKICFAVADGMGGHQKGEVASKFILTKLNSYLEYINSENDLLKYLKLIKDEFDIFAIKNPQFKDMGTVIAGILFLENRYVVFNVGDCRVYENKFGFANQITRDHSLVYNLYSNGVIGIDEINTHPKKNIVTSAFIANEEQKLDEIYIREFELRSNKQFVTNHPYCFGG